jgi:hypothetical protein
VSFAAAVVLPLWVAPGLGAQTVARGRVVKVTGRDSIPVPAAPTVLHRIGREVQAPVDSTTTDRQGRFRFRFSADTSSIYLVSARWGGIEYFSTPVHLNPERPDTGLRIVVADTSSTAPVQLEARHLVLAPPGADGSRSVLDLIVLRNPGDRTRVAPDTVRPSWSGPLPGGTVGLEVGEGEFSARAVARRDGRLLFFAPFPPGEKQVVVEYLLPSGARETRLTFDQPAGLVNVLVAEPGVEVSGPGIAFADTQVIDGRSYRRWTGALAAGTAVRIAFPGLPAAVRWVLPALVAIVAGVLVAAGATALRRPAVAGGAAGTAAATADGLLARLATLDVEYGGREADTPPEVWRLYQSERSRLKAELAAALRSTLLLLLVLLGGWRGAEAGGDTASDTVFAIRAGDRLVGRTAWCGFPAPGRP